ncbi:RSC complex [Lecanosticta acicola]|uniref:RSC complex n=1 Tax=Lecanosticta acicola TaxID=111012 RepID=A0AAI8Z2S6_9PEZI|nr:RSC complex [Lecanosticta acicola]
MDSARKRKASNATPNSTEGSASGSKRIKLLAQGAGSDNLTAVQKVGFKLLNQLNNGTDKTGRSITDAFQELPSRDELPSYYEQIKMPLALDIIEEKLKKNVYPTITTLESDFKRMIQNAKDFNMPKSEVYEDAERIRKLVYNFMKVHNPQYQLDPTYSSFPTPIPTTTPRLTLTNGAAREHEAVKPEPKSREASTKPRPSTAPKNSEPPSDRKSSVAPSAATGDVGDGEDMDFTGKSFQKAQMMIIDELMGYTDDEGLQIFTPFVNLPSRKLEDYYRTIKHPMCLKGVQKKIRGQHGRDPPTGVNTFKTWQEFENAVSFIWRNAREYNQDGSEMYELAGDLENIFKSRLAEAKEKVEEPAKPSIKIGGPKQATKSGITLNLNQHRNSPTPGVSVDIEALARQRQMVQAGVNGQQQQHRATPPNMNGASIPLSAMPGTDSMRPPSSAHAGSPAAAGVKFEKSTLSPAPASHQLYTNGMMPPPMLRPTSGSPFPTTNGMNMSSYHYTAPGLLPPTQIRDYPASQALLPVVTISTHPQLDNVQKPYSLAIPPHPTLSHQSTTITLPPAHLYLQIAPTISRELSMGRPYKMFVTLNGTRLAQRDTQFHADSGKRTHVYEGNLAPGVNRLEIEVAAAKADDSKGLDVEKIVVYCNLQKQD